jgi:hypothetical protein
MDFVYICRSGDNEELRYSIRSVVENIPHNNVWLIGGKPKWYSGPYIKYENKYGNKFMNIQDALQVAAKTSDITDDFVYMNDDFFIVHKLESMPSLRGGLLKDRIEKSYEMSPSSYYARLLERTYDYLIKNNITDEPLDYDTHIPMVLNKENLATLKQRQYSVRTIYGNVFKIEAEPMQDVKVYNGGRFKTKSFDDFNKLHLPFISSNDVSFEDVYKKVLKEMLPNPTIYES